MKNYIYLLNTTYQGYKETIKAFKKKKDAVKERKTYLHKNGGQFLSHEVVILKTELV